MVVDAFYSDPHFGHDKIRLPSHADRPFGSLEEMNAQLVARYNGAVGETDTVLWLGDAFWKVSRRYRELMASLNGRKIIILGNHDAKPSKMAAMGFELVLHGAIMNIAGRTCRLCHYPYAGAPGRGVEHDDRYAELRPPRIKGEVLIHGHTHQRERVRENMIHVGVDAWDFRPVLRSEVEQIIERRFPGKS
jgi:calcineurin-like phosphoesterase family protein